MIDKLIALDKELFLYLNGKHEDWLDPAMLLLSSYTTWTIVFVVCGILIYLLQKKYRGATVIFYALSVGLTALLVNGLKLLVRRPRPIHEDDWTGLIHNIEKHSDAFSFFSSHAATTFCIAMFITLLLKSKKYYRYLICLWALGVSYSRIYLSKHYPLDVLVGIFFGVLMGYMGYKMLTKYILSKERVS